jgi:hypothetical protein
LVKTGGVNESASPSFRPQAIPSTVAEQAGQATFLLVASEEEAHLLRYRIGEAEFESSMNGGPNPNAEFVILVAGTPEEEAGLFAALSASTDGSVTGPNVNIVDLRP